MGSVFRKTTTRPVPAGATVAEQGGKPVARWKTRAGRWTTAEVVTTADGRKVIRQESGTFFAKYRDHDGTVRVVPTGCRDESAAKQILRDLEKRADQVRAGVFTKQDLAVAERMADPIDRHIADYASTLTGSASHRENTERYIRRLAADCRWSCLGDLRRDDLQLWLAGQSRPGPDGRPARSARSRNGHHVAVVSFCNWLVEVKRMRANPFARMKRAKIKLDRRRVRRSLSADEVERIAVAAEDAPGRPPTKPNDGDSPNSLRPAQRLTAADRAFLWRFLFGTGLRLNEARGLTVGNLMLDGDRPGIDLPPTITKAKELQYVPLSPALSGQLRRHVQGRKPSSPVFSIPADILKRFKADCRRAGIPLLDERGRTIDIHALRTSFIDGLVKAGVPPKIVQELARHSDMSVTMEYYTDIRVNDLHAAIATVAPSASVAPAPSVAPSVAPTGVISGATESSAVNPAPDPDSPQVLDLQGKERVS